MISETKICGLQLYGLRAEYNSAMRAGISAGRIEFLLHDSHRPFSAPRPSWFLVQQINKPLKPVRSVLLDQGFHDLHRDNKMRPTSPACWASVNLWATKLRAKHKC